MKADLSRREPEILAAWEKEALYSTILEAHRNDPLFVFHDGPPYANGHIHYGHILNKTLKDLVVKSRTMAGHRVVFKPGWDCHGLPIELAVLRELGDKAAGLSAVQIREACNAYAMRWVVEQTREFQRLGVFGTFDSPYLTLDKSYEATIIRQLAEFARKGLLYRDRKPVHWCMSDKTALAEAEIEYDEKHVSPSIYVKFRIGEAGEHRHAVIWTTTPWTLPANHAIAFHPEFSYVAVTAADAAGKAETYVVAEKLKDSFLAACHLTESASAPFAVSEFAKLESARHPFMDRPSRFLAADHVTLEQGTGLVHTAPGHGADDYVLGKKNGLPIDAPVDDSGVFTAGPWKGEHVFKANPKIVQHLHDIGALASPVSLKVTHAYPICWRCKNPVIFRATEQWFARLDKPIAGNANENGDGKTLRERALEGIQKTRWIPDWGISRISGMIENRPDWVLSRQRVWGVPIPIFYMKNPDGTEAVVEMSDAQMAQVMEHVAGIVEKEGASAWFARDAKELVPAELLPLWGESGPTKGRDIVDVWFESGVSWAAVCEGKDGLDSSQGKPGEPPVDLYLEGSDQHRGWFHSALLTSAASRGHAPYRAVLTHGFVLDERGRPYSKSEIEKARREGIKIEFIPPEDVIKTQGAELLRMWTAAADFRSDIHYSRGHLTQLGESYRKLRNTSRFLLGNLHGYDPEYRPALDNSDQAIVDRYLLSRIRQLQARVAKAYADYEFHVVLKSLLDLCINDLSSLYLDVRKDRLYCDPLNSPLRKLTQYVLYQAARQLALSMAPIACFTADEIWAALPKRKGDPARVHVARFEQLPALYDDSEDEVRRFEGLLALRSLVQSKLEPFRAEKHASLDAKVILTAPPATRELIAEAKVGMAALADLFIVSQVVIEPDEVLDARVTLAEGRKCERCWKYTTDSIGDSESASNSSDPSNSPASNDQLCNRCRAAIDALSR